IASYAPVYGAISHEHDFLLRSFYDVMLDHPDWEVGRLALASKLGYFLYRQDAGVPSQYVLLGDPALRLAQPETEKFELRVQASELFAQRVPNIQVQGALADSAEAEGRLWLEDRTGRPVGEPQELRLRNGRFSTTLTFSEPLSRGDYAVVARFVDSEGRIHRAQHRLNVD